MHKMMEEMINTIPIFIRDMWTESDRTASDNFSCFKMPPKKDFFFVSIKHIEVIGKSHHCNIRVGGVGGGGSNRVLKEE